MELKCENCGHIIKEGEETCPNCSAAIENKMEKGRATDGKEAVYIIVFLVSFAVGFFAEVVMGQIGNGLIGFICFILSLVTIVAGYFKYPESKAIKVLFWLFAAFVVLSVIYVVVSMLSIAHSFLSCINQCP